VTRFDKVVWVSAGIMATVDLLIALGWVDRWWQLWYERKFRKERESE
jgi:hypothetical protein